MASSFTVLIIARHSDNSYDLGHDRRAELLDAFICISWPQGLVKLGTGSKLFDSPRAAVHVVYPLPETNKKGGM
jgi:hypothetical protein